VLPVSVTDSAGDFVSGLKPQGFRVYEDGRPQEIALFRQEDTPVAVGLAIDRSRSMGSKLPGVTAAVSAFAASSNPRDDMFVVDFGDDVALEPLGQNYFSSDPKELEKALSVISAAGQTALYDGLDKALRHLQFSHWEKKALIVVSDGGDNASFHKYSEVLAEARQSQALVYCIGLVGDSEEEENPGLLQRLSNETGGIAFFPKPGQSIEGVSTQIARDLRTQYTIGFVPQKKGVAGSFHKIQVKVSVPGRGKIRVRTRSGYFLPGKTQAEAQDR